MVNILKFKTPVAFQKALTSSADPDQNASEEAFLSGSYLFAIWTRILSITALITILVEDRKRKVFEILEHLPYFDDERLFIVIFAVYFRNEYSYIMLMNIYYHVC